MAEMLLTIQHNGILFSPPVEEGVQIEWERVGSPGKLTFTTVNIPNAQMDFTEGDRVCFYYDKKPVFMGYVFTKKVDREQKIQVTCYDQIRYLKNKYSYVFEDKSATEIIKAICKDYNLKIGTFDDTKYLLPVVAKENTAVMDVVLSVLEDTLLNTGKMYVFYDDFGELKLRNAVNMTSNVMITKETAENFDYSSSIDGETYNSVVLYYDPNASQGTTTSSSNAYAAFSDVQKVLNIANQEIGVTENPKGSNKVKYNQEYYGSNAGHAWCCVFLWWVFKEAGLSNLFYGGEPTAYCPTLEGWFKSQNRYYKSNYQPGDIIFFDYKKAGRATHVGIIEKVNNDGSVVIIEGNYGDKVMRRTCSTNIRGVGRPAYDGVAHTPPTEEDLNELKDGSPTRTVKVYTAQSPETIRQWGLLRLFEGTNSPSFGQAKATALLKLYNRKTRELTVSKAFGSTDVRGGTLLPVILDLGDTKINNYMLVEKVTHNFNTDHYTMDLTLEGEWNDPVYNAVANTYNMEVPDNRPNTSGIGVNSGISVNLSGSDKGVSGGTLPNKSATDLLNKGKHTIINIECFGTKAYRGDVVFSYYYNGKLLNRKLSKYAGSTSILADTAAAIDMTVYTYGGYTYKLTQDQPLFENIGSTKLSVTSSNAPTKKITYINSGYSTKSTCNLTLNWMR